MAVVYVEPRPKARTEHEPIDHYVVEEVGDKVLDKFKTQGEVRFVRGKGHLRARSGAFRSIRR